MNDRTILIALLCPPVLLSLGCAIDQTQAAKQDPASPATPINDREYDRDVPKNPLGEDTNSIAAKDEDQIETRVHLQDDLRVSPRLAIASDPPAPEFMDEMTIEIDMIFAALPQAPGNCYPDCDTSTGKGVLDVFDFICFQDDFLRGGWYACECDTSTGAGVCDTLDFLCFQRRTLACCP